MSIQFSARRGALASLLSASLVLAAAGAFAADATPAPARATLQQVYTAETLYTCPMHPAVVSADPKLDCPLCEMHLAPMDSKARKVLLDQKLVGCPMDPIVVKAEGAPNCPVCGMKLSAIAPPMAVGKAAGAQSAAPADACSKAQAAAAAGCCKAAAGSEQTDHTSHKH